VLKGVDGVVFVADSQVAAFDGNVESFHNLEVNLAEMGLTTDTMPLVLQYNKRDIRNIVPVERLNAVLNTKNLPYFEAAALHGIGVFETLKAISRVALSSVRERIAAENAAGKKPGVAPARGAAPAAAVKAPPSPVAAPVVAKPMAPAAVAAPALASVSDLKVEFAEEDPEKHVVRPVSTKGNVDIQDALSKLRMSVTPAARPAAGSKPPGSPAGSDLDRRLKDVMVAVNDSDKQELRKKLSVEVPADLLRMSSAIHVHVTFERDGHEEPLSEDIVLKLSGNRRIERLGVHLDLELKAKS
jgi:signal recognition particle receptor subunit beta